MIVACKHLRRAHHSRNQRSHAQVARQRLGSREQVGRAALVPRAAAGQQRAGEFEQATRDPGRRLRARVRLQCVLEMANGVFRAAQRRGQQSEVARGRAAEVDAAAAEDAKAVARQEQFVEPRRQRARLRAARRPRRRAPRALRPSTFRVSSVSSQSATRSRYPRARASRPASAMNRARLPCHIAAAPPDSGRVSTSSRTKRSTSAARSAPRPTSFQHHASWTLDAVMPFQLPADSAAASASLASRSASLEAALHERAHGVQPGDPGSIERLAEAIGETRRRQRSRRRSLPSVRARGGRRGASCDPGGPARAPPMLPRGR